MCTDPCKEQHSLLFTTLNITVLYCAHIPRHSSDPCSREDVEKNGRAGFKGIGAVRMRADCIRNEKTKHEKGVHEKLENE